jgi:predicted ATPase
LICIEEPLGLHPDAIQIVAEMLKEASRRTQLIVTTHSSSLVSALSAPEAVMVCERDFDGSTTLRRLEADRLKKWLNDYSLGDLWLMGELGGTH